MVRHVPAYCAEIPLVVVVLLVLSAVSASRPASFSVTDPEQVRMVERLDSYHITFPARVRRDGSHLTHDVARTYDVTAVFSRDVSDAWSVGPSGRRRRRRSVRQERRRGRRRDGITHYRLQLGSEQSEEVVVDMLPNRRMLAPGFVIERRAASGRLGRLQRLRRLCLMQGRVRKWAGSRVALSTCSGLSGYIHSGEHHYIVEPVKGVVASPQQPRPHIIYQHRPHHTGGAAQHRRAKQPWNCPLNDSVARSDWSPEELLYSRRARSTARSHRPRRSVSAERNVETLIVADPDVVQFYANDDVETYLLTVMNGVSQLYHDASIGNAINVILVRIMILDTIDDSSLTFNVSQDGDSSLKSFCNWQIAMNPASESHPNHHDVAVLLTRRNICSENETCNTLGLAEVAGMCQPSRSCNINQDTGLSVSYTIAHELGHNFGMNHDGPSNGCDKADGRRQHVMAPNLVSDVTPVVWSRCSRREITKFLDRDWGHCLDDQPADHEFSYPEVPPGALYDADHQCKLLYGPAASHCDMGNLCETLWCSVQGRCVTKLQPAAEGTRCHRHPHADNITAVGDDDGDGDPADGDGGEDNEDAGSGTNTSLWCSAGECVAISRRPGAVDGGWGRWGEWGPCSRSCGTGVQVSERHCDRPVPAYGGKYCVGERRRYSTCAQTSCPEDSMTFRAHQCAEFNPVPYQGENYTWMPVYDQAAACQLTCRPEGHHFTTVLSDTVKDGTPCRLGSDDICINGKCRTMGCDGVLGSEARADRCGKCHGSGRLCHTIRDTFTVSHGDGYMVVVGIPTGARSIKVEEGAGTENGSFLAVTDSDEGVGFLNDKWFIQWSGEYRVPGSVLYYFRDDHNETLFIPGPLKKAIILKVLLKNSGTRVRYEYTVPGHEGSEAAQVFTWQYQAWSECSVHCGGGEQASVAVCMEDEAGRVEDIYCPRARPESRVRPCNTHQCPPRWWSGPWQPCSARCGQPGRRKRQVVCVRSAGADSMHARGECDQLNRPPGEQACETPAERCPAQWEVGPWNQTGCKVDPCRLRYRTVRCPAPPHCRHDHRPPSVRTCDLVQCQLQRGGRPLSRHLRRRRPHGSVVDHAAATILQRSLSPGHRPLSVHRGDAAVQLDHQLQLMARSGGQFTPAGNYSWHVASWGECNAACGEGRRKREALCVDAASGEHVELSRCPRPVPTIETSCIQPCQAWVTHDWAPCSAMCGDGVLTREVRCPRLGHCDLDRRPVDTLPCRQQPCTQWRTGDWKPCSASCGKGYTMRTTFCLNIENGARVASSACATARPITKKACNLPDCSTTTDTESDRECKDTIKPVLCKKMAKKLCSKATFKAQCCATCTRLA